MCSGEVRYTKLSETTDSVNKIVDRLLSIVTMFQYFNMYIDVNGDGNGDHVNNGDG